MEATAPVEMGYDEAGNRLWMTDGMGRVDYGYDPLSRLEWEERQFSGMTRSHRITYSYNLANQIKSITDPFDSRIDYGYDAAGQLGAVTGTPYAGVSTYASNLQYRAWGSVKAMTYGNGRTISASYDARLQVSHFNTPGVLSKEYQYHEDGRLKFSRDLLDNRFDRSYSYDHAGRMTQALSGPAARGEADTSDRPYNQSFQYDPWGRLTQRTSLHWEGSYSFNHTYVSGRNTVWQYDAGGNLISDQNYSYTYDAAGRVSAVRSVAEPPNDSSNAERSTDGDGRQVWTRTSVFEAATQSTTTTTLYYVRSTVLGGRVISEVTQGGAKERGFVYLGGEVLAWQQMEAGVERVLWEHRDPGNLSFRTSNPSGGTTGNGEAGQAAELDPTGNNVGLSSPYLLNTDVPAEGTGSLLPYPSSGTPANRQTSYRHDGMPVTYDRAMELLNSTPSGAAFTLLYASRQASNYYRRYTRAGEIVVSTSRDLGVTGRDPVTGDDIIGGERNVVGIIPLYRVGVTSLSVTPSLLLLAPTRPQETYPGVLGNIRFVATEGTAVGDNRQKIVGQIQNMAFSKRCSDMFRKAGLATPDEIVQKGLIIGPSSALHNSRNNAAFGISEAQRKEYKGATTTSNPLLFIGGLTVQGKDFSDGRARIWFTADGMRKAFTETVIHELMHAAGAGRYDAWTGHDLKNFNQNGVTYKDIINACNKR